MPEFFLLDLGPKNLAWQGPFHGLGDYRSGKKRKKSTAK